MALAGRDTADLPEPLREGRRAVDGVSGVRLLGEPEQTGTCWVFHCWLTIAVESGSSFPPSTEWFVCVDPEYPFGDISFYPANTGGLPGTYWHQRHHGAGTGQWTSGKICLSPAEGYPSRSASLVEGRQASSRLAWHFTRALEWLRDASAGRLALPGEHFELPDHAPDASRVVAFCEDDRTLSRWRASGTKFGLASLAQLSRDPDVLAVARFLDIKGETVLEPEWGSLVSTPKRSAFAAWLRVPGIPVIDPWQAPTTWGDLRACTRRLGYQLDPVLRCLFRKLRDRERHVLLVGYEIPDLVAGPAVRMHWVPAALAAVAQKAPDGFRANDTGLWRSDRVGVVRDDRTISWLTSENWAELDFGTRGRLPVRLLNSRVLLLGAGALGSMVGELLVRGGVRHITIIDGERITGGNLVRHTLTLRDVAQPKAEALAAHLNALAPRCIAIAIPGSFPPPREQEFRSCHNDHDIVIDCTGNNDVIAALEAFPWGREVEFWSFSLSSHANQAFIFSQKGRALDGQRFFREMAPWSAQELESSPQLTREGIGCWHPVFPARADEVWQIAARCVEFMADNAASDARFTVLNRVAGPPGSPTGVSDA